MMFGGEENNVFIQVRKSFVIYGMRLNKFKSFCNYGYVIKKLFKKNVTRETDKLVSQKESVRNRRMLESKVESIEKLFVLISKEIPKFRGRNFFKGVDCNITLNL